MNIEARCDHHSETAGHILWEYPFARNICTMVRGKIQKCSNTGQDIFLIFRMLMSKLEIEELEVWATLSWAIWNARNKFYFKRVQLQPKFILDNALNLLIEYRCLTEAQRQGWLLFSPIVFLCLGLLYFVLAWLRSVLFLCLVYRIARPLVYVFFIF